MHVLIFFYDEILLKEHIRTSRLPRELFPTGVRSRSGMLLNLKILIMQIISVRRPIIVYGK